MADTNDERALQWLVRALARHPEGQATLADLLDARAPVEAGAMNGLLRHAAALGLVAYQGPNADGSTLVWLTIQGEQALGALQRADDAE